MSRQVRPRVILDCDPGHDDAMAILMAARHSDLVGITTVAGNAPLEATTRNALLVAQIADIDVPVHAGASRPLMVEPHPASHIHGESGLAGPDLPELEREPAGHDAVAWIIDTVRSTEGIWLVPIGPLTNIAMAFRQAPDIVDRVAGVSIMGGSAGPGNVTPTAEFNIWHDPEAAAIVFDSGVGVLRMCGLNLTWQYQVDDTVVEALDAMGTRTAGFAADLFRFFLDANQARSGRRQAPLHDPCAVMAVTHPELFEAEPRHVAVETRGVHTVGMTVVDERGFLIGEEPNTEVMYTIDRDRAMDLFLDTVAGYR